MKKDDFIGLFIIGGFVGLGAVVISCLSGFWGSRGISKDYSFKFKNEQAYIMHEDIKWGPDNYWIEIGKTKIERGVLISDDDKRIEVISGAGFEISDYVQEK